MKKSIKYKRICQAMLAISSIMINMGTISPVFAADDPEVTVTNSQDITIDSLTKNKSNIDQKTQDLLTKHKPAKKKARKADDKDKNDDDQTETEASMASTGSNFSLEAFEFNPVSLTDDASITKRLDYAVSLAKKLSKMGIPYVYGGNSIVTGLDCSALTLYLYNHIGIGLPRTAAQQAGSLTSIPLEQAIPGDLLFWGMSGSEYHVGIYIGNNQFVAAPAPGQTVSVQNISGAFYPSHAGTIRQIKK